MMKPQTNTCQVHLWKYCLLDPVPEISMRWFSMDEKEAIAKRRAYEDRMRFFRVHAFLKKVLEQYVHQPVEQIQLVKGLNGKPFIKCDHTYPPFFFSLSYRHDYALLAISNETHVGVDVEEMEVIDDFFSFLFDHFSATERERILAEESGPRQQSLLFTLWTMKEAVVKSLAIGLSDKLNKYDLSSFLDDPMGSQKVDLSDFGWIEPVHVSENYKAAIACRSQCPGIKMFRYANDLVQQ